MESLERIEAIDLRFLKLKHGYFSSLNISKSNEFFVKFDSEIFDIMENIMEYFQIESFEFSKCVLAFLIWRYTDQESFGILSQANDNKDVMTIFDFSQATNIVTLINKSLRMENIASVKSSISFNLETDISAFNDIHELDFSLKIRKEVKSIEIIIRCKESSINKGLMETFIELYKQSFVDLLSDLYIMRDKNRLIDLKSYDLLKSKDRSLIETWNQTHHEFDIEETIHHLFEKQVEKTPDNIAVVHEGVKLSYRELNEKANQLANYLISNYEIKPDDLIALLLDRSEKMILCILAVFKTGAAYVPISPDYPDERIKYMLVNTSAKKILLNDKYKTRIHELANDFENPLNIIPFDSSEMENVLSSQHNCNPQPQCKSDNLAYIIYTSGTTGNPKGVMIEHRSVINLILYFNNLYQLMKNEVFLFVVNYVFDASVESIFLCLLHGHSLVIPENLFWINSEDFSNYLSKMKITHMNFTPSFLNQFSDTFKFKYINRVVLGGEKVTPELYDKIVGSRSDKLIEVFNSFGPTECTVTSVSIKMDRNNLVIGKPIFNANCYVLDSNLNVLPIGAIGELYIGGIGVARGYLNNSEQTSKKFITNIFQLDEEKQDLRFGPNGRNSNLYKTGDLVRWLPSGILDYIGRNDFQVKIRGMRVELGEIERVLCTFPNIKQCHVMLNDISNNSNNNKVLVAYYINDIKVNNHDSNDHKNIRKYLMQQLPEHMVPNHYIQMEKFPSTINGKIDVKALPKPIYIIQEGHIAPRNKLEAYIAKLCSDIIGIDLNLIGIKEDFFELGGSSLSAIKLTSKIKANIDENVDRMFVFKYRTIELMAQNIEQSECSITSIKKANPVNKYAQLLSFSQEDFWLDEMISHDSKLYIIPLTFKVHKHVELDLIEKSIKKIVSRHEILRTLIRKNENGDLYQDVASLEDKPLNFNYIEASSQDQLDELLGKEKDLAYDLSCEYPIRVSIYSLKNHNVTVSYLSINIHHIAFDGWSSSIFFNELKEFYDYYLKNEESELKLPTLDVQYKDYAIWQRTNYFRSDKYLKELKYWENKLKDYEILNLINDIFNVDEYNLECKSIFFEIDEDISDSLRDLAKQLKISLFSLMLSCFCLMLRVYCKQDDFVIGTITSNRHYEIENLVGCFINDLALRIKINSNGKLNNFFEYVADEVTTTLLNQDFPIYSTVYNPLLIDTNETNKSINTIRNQIIQIIFVVQSFGTDKNKQNSEQSQNNNINDLLEIYEPKGESTFHSRYDIFATIDDDDRKFKGDFNYNISLFNESTIREYIDTYKEVLYQVVSLNNKIKHESNDLKINDLKFTKN